jgi:hypothetical protein
MQIAPPYGYKSIVPLNRAQKVRLPQAGEIPEFARSINAIPISYSEFAMASHEYAIAFTQTGDSKTFSPVVVLGMVDGENLYNQSNRWAGGAYMPVYARRYPFCMARVTLDKVEQKNRLICIEKSFLDDAAGEAMFDDKGQPSEKWQAIEKLLSEYENDMERTREMCGILSDYALLEPFTMQAKLTKGGSQHAMTGMFRVAEAKIEHLNASQLKNLVKKGVLSRIYAHLLSLDNFARLLDRKAARTAA